jgi:hypothetical protein
VIPRPATKMICAISRLKRVADEKLRKLISQRRQHLSACRLTARLDRPHALSENTTDRPKTA